MVIEMLVSWLQTCPLVDSLFTGTLPPGRGTGLFLKGIDRVHRDILGNQKPRWRCLIRHRGSPEENWAEAFSCWVLEATPPAGYRISPGGGRLVSPTRDGWGTWEVELIIEN